MIPRDFEMERLWGVFSKELLSVIPAEKFRGALLDVGCGYGILVDEAGKSGYNAVGIDIIKERVEYSKLHLNGKCLLEDLFAYKPKERFDVVVANHFIEHFENPYPVLQRIKALMKDDGLLILGTPNIDGGIAWFLEKIGLKEKWYLYGRDEHKIIYCPNTLKFVLEQNGFKVVKTKLASNHFGGNAVLLKPLLCLFKLLGWGDNIIILARKYYEKP